MVSLDPLVTRIRGEYQEMPGLRLTFAQACRLWQLDAATCHAVLHHLVDGRVLYRTAEGAYIAFPDVRLRTAKAGLSDERRAPLRARA